MPCSYVFVAYCNPVLSNKTHATILLIFVYFQLTGPGLSDNLYEVEVYKRHLTRQNKLSKPSSRKAELTRIPVPQDEFPEFDPWDDDINIYQDNTDSSDDSRYSFIARKR